MASKSDLKDKKWEQVQIKAFTSWVNQTFDKNGITPVSNILDLSDGVKLPQFLECITGKTLKFDKTPAARIQKIQNLALALKFISDDLNVKLVGIGAEDVLDGNMKLILGLLWSMFRQVKLGVLGGGDAKTAERGLLDWIREMTAGYEGVNIVNFKESFNDGLAFSALIHKFDPSLLDYSAVDKSGAHKGENLTKAFHIAESQLAIPSLLDVQDLVDGNPDERSVILYASLFFHAYLSTLDKREKEIQKQEITDKLTQLQSRLDALTAENEEIKRRGKSQADRIVELEQIVQQKDDLIKQLQDRIKALEDEIEFLRQKALRDAEAMALLEDKVNILTELLDHEHEEKSTIDASRNRMQKQLEELKRQQDALDARNKNLDASQKQLTTEADDRARALQELEDRKKALMSEIEGLRNQVKKEIEKRRAKAKELLALQRENELLRQREINQRKARHGLDVLKRNLEEHLEDLYRWKELHQQDLEEKPQFNLEKVLEDISKKPFEDQLEYLDSKLQEENKSLLRIIRLKDSKLELEDVILKEGWLLMKGRKEWKRRYFRLRGSKLLYYEDDESPITKYDGSVDLNEGCEIVRQKAIKGEEEGGKKQWPLKITVGEKKLFIRAASKKERHSWYFFIASRITHLNYLKEVEATKNRADTRLINLFASEEVPNLYLDHMPIPKEGILALSKALIAHDETITLSVSSASVGDDAVAVLADVFNKLSIKVLKLNNNNITSSGVTAIAKSTENFLEELHLANNKFDDTGIASICEAFISKGKLNVLDISGNPITGSGIQALVSALNSAEKTPSTLTITNANLDDSSAKAIASVLAANKNIATLNLANNKIGDAGASALAQALASNEHLVSLDLSNNNVGTEGAAAISRALQSNGKLNDLNLSNNKHIISGAGIAPLSSDVYGFQDLKFLRLNPE